MASNYKQAIKRDFWYEDIYIIESFDPIQGSEGVEFDIQEVDYEDLGFDDKSHGMMLSNSTHSQKYKNLIILGNGEPTSFFNSKLQNGEIGGYKERSNIENDIQASENITNNSTLLTKMENKKNNFGITSYNYEKIFYIDISTNEKDAMLQIYKISDLGDDKITIYHPNNLFTQPRNSNVHPSSDVVDWLGFKIEDYGIENNNAVDLKNEWDNLTNYPAQFSQLNVSEYNKDMELDLYTNPTWERLTSDVFYVQGIRINSINTGGQISLIIGSNDSNYNEISFDHNIKINTLFANVIKTLNSDESVSKYLNVDDVYIMLNEDQITEFDGRYAIKRFDSSGRMDSNVAFDDSTNRWVFHYDNNSPSTGSPDITQLLDLKVNNIVFGNANQLYNNSVKYDHTITNQGEFDAVFTSAITDNVSIYLYDGIYNLNNSVNIGNKVKIISQNGAIINFNNTGCTFYSSSSIKDCNINVNVKCNTGVTNIFDLTNISESKINISTYDLDCVNIINSGIKNNVYVINKDSNGYTNIFKDLNGGLITGRTLTGSGQQLFSNCTNISVKIINNNDNIIGSGDFNI